MARYPNWLRNSLLAACAGALPVLAVEVPTGAELDVRLKTKIGSNTSKANDPVEAILIAPVLVNNKPVIPEGATVRGAIVKATAVTDPKVRAVLSLDFNEIEMGGVKMQVHTLLTAVENAREKVNEQGEIQGILASDSLSARMDAGINKVAQKYSGLGSFLEAAKSAVFKETEGDITYGAGVEMDLKLTAPVAITGTLPPGPEGKIAVSLWLGRDPRIALAAPAKREVA